MYISCIFSSQLKEKVKIFFFFKIFRVNLIKHCRENAPSQSIFLSLFSDYKMARHWHSASAVVLGTQVRAGF